MKIFFLSIFFILLFSCSSPIEGKLNAKSNILFILADDQAYDTVGALGNKDIETPALDSLVKQGLTFTHAYNMGAWKPAVCVASRSMLNSGKFLTVAKNFDFSKNKESMWSLRLKKAGYKTYFTGKWHVQKIDPKMVFDVVTSPRGGMPNQTKARYNRTFNKKDTWRPWDTANGGFWRGGKHWSEVVADDTIAFLADAKTEGKPFFIYAAFNAPHDPRQSPKSYVDKYPLENIILPTSFLPKYPYWKEIGMITNSKKNKIMRDERLAPYPRTLLSVKKNIQEYYAIITHMDAQIKRILTSLKENGFDKNTYVIFTADHGLAVGKHGFMGKQNVYDHSIRVPFIINGPNIAKNRKINTDIYLQDIVPTTLDWSGVSKEGIDFKSLLPLIERKETNHYDYITGTYIDFQKMVRKDSMKLIHYPEASVYRFYDLKKDPKERKDLINKVEYYNQINELKDIMKKYFSKNKF